MTDWTGIVPLDCEQPLRDRLGLDESWTFVPKTDGFMKAKPCPIPDDLQKVYDKQNGHTR